MNFFTITKLLRVVVLSALLSVGSAAFTSVAFAQVSSVDSASVPFVVNVNATVSATDGAATKQISVTANQEAVLRLPLLKADGILYFGTQRQANAKAVVISRGGKVAVNLSAESYKSAEVSLYTVSGKRVLRVNASAASATNNIPRRNIAPGAYLLSVKGTDGNAVTSRLTHSGGGLAIDVAFVGKGLSASDNRLAKEAAAGDWTITVRASGYIDSVYTLRPTAGMNALQNITLREGAGGGGDSYDYVELGGLKWMKKNLNVETADSWCYGNSTANCDKYGRLYTWAAAKSACQSVGLRLPRNAEWKALETAAGGSDSAGKQLKSTTGWKSSSGITNDDTYGFSALPGGVRYSDGSFEYVGEGGNWWTATEQRDNSAYSRSMFYSWKSVHTDYGSMAAAYSARCVMGESIVDGGDLSDARDGKTYKTVIIGGQRWMAENLNYAASNSWCYGSSPDSCAKYGRLYNWKTAGAVCPRGWKLPSRQEWGDLAITADGSGTYGESGTAGRLLKSTSGWKNNGNGTDDFGFKALPGGYLYGDFGGSFKSGGERGYWWTATEYADLNAYGRTVGDGNGLGEVGMKKKEGLSVRCMQDKDSDGGDGGDGGDGDIDGDELFDARDGKTYKTALIGLHRWMAENLNYEASYGSKCYDDNPDNCEMYGRLYMWGGAISACPTGWSLPSVSEWQDLALWAGGTGAKGDGGSAGRALKSTSGWYGGGNGTDVYGFNALPGGNGSAGAFTNVGKSGYWWTASRSGDEATYRSMGYDYAEVRVNAYPTGWYFSVRCIQD